MTLLLFFKSCIGAIWSGMSRITVPLLDIPVTSMLLGVFIVGVAIGILQPLLGIGGGIIDAFASGARASRSRATARSSAREHAFYRNRAEAERKLHDVSRWV